MIYREFYTCKKCGNTFLDRCLTCGWGFREKKIICPNCKSEEKPEKRKYLLCPECLEPVVEESRVRDMAGDLPRDKYCTNCGYRIDGIIQAEREKARKMADIK